MPYIQNSLLKASDSAFDIGRGSAWTAPHEMKKGIKAGRKQGRKQGERLGTLKTLCTLINDSLLKADEAVRRAKLSEKAFDIEMQKAGYR